MRSDSLTNVPMPPQVNLSQELAVTNDALIKAEQIIDSLSKDFRVLKENM